MNRDRKILALIAVGVIVYLLIPSKGVNRLVILQVGQGDSIVLQESGKTMLVDAGPKTDTFDAGRRLVLPELRRLAVQDIDVLIITHPDRDHTGGLQAIASRHKIGTVLISDRFQGHESLVKTLAEAKIPLKKVVWIKEFGEFSLGSAKVHVVAPPYGQDDNSKSLFVSVRKGQSSAMLTGDAPAEAESWYLSKYRPAKHEILMAGHHGSRSSTSAEWIKNLQPEFIVASCGRGNQFGHPDPAVLERAKQAKVPLLRTDLDGAIEFRHSPAGFVLFGRAPK